MAKPNRSFSNIEDDRNHMPLEGTSPDNSQPPTNNSNGVPGGTGTRPRPARSRHSVGNSTNPRIVSPYTNGTDIPDATIRVGIDIVFTATTSFLDIFSYQITNWNRKHHG